MVWILLSTVDGVHGILLVLRLLSVDPQIARYLSYAVVSVLFRYFSLLSLQIFHFCAALLWVMTGLSSVGMES